MSDFEFEEFGFENESDSVEVVEESVNSTAKLDTLQTRHRPQSWDAIIGQDHITSILKGIIINETWRFTRSYIFSGCIDENQKLRVRKRYYSEDEWEYTHLSIRDAKDLMESGDYEIEVSSGDGWVGIKEFIDSGVKSCVEISTPDFTLICSEDHLIDSGVKDSNGEIIFYLASEISEGDLVLTEYGIQPVMSVKSVGDRQTYDLSVNHINQRYFAEGISSHNCPGSGKTSSSRVFAKAICCDHPDKTKRPCNECESCKKFNSGTYPDYLEVDGASYNKVEDVKVLTDVAKIYPTNPNKARIILIDEAHRLSNAAWDTMLKLLEDGVTKTIFMFATTEGDKIRPAIQSRSIVFSVRPLSVHEIARELTRICKSDGIPYDSKSIESIAYAFRGRTRDAIKTLDTYNRAYGKVVDISIKSDEEVMLEMIKSAYFNQMDDAFKSLDSLITSDSKLGGILCNALTALYVYPNQIVSSVPDSVLASHKQLFGRDIRKLIETFNEFRPESYETMKLFLIIVAEMGVNTQVGGEKSKQSGEKATRSLFRGGSNERVKKSVPEVKKEIEVFAEDFTLEEIGFNKV